MAGLAEYLKKVYTNCRIPFKVCINGNIVFEADPEYFKTEVFEEDFLLGSYKCSVSMPISFKESIGLLKFCIEDKFCMESTSSEKFILDLLNGIDVSDEKIKENTEKLREDTFLIVINVKNKIDEAIEILNDVYNDMEILIVRFKEYIILLGSFENIKEHTSSIYETLYTSVYEKCYISYIDISDLSCLKNKFDLCIGKLNLAKKYNVSGRIFGRDSLIFESIIDNLHEDEISRIIDKFNEGFEKLDNDIIQSIDIFFEVNLNISEAAKRLYVHRNTLIYRLDKIQKYTSYDIRKFNDAVIFKVAFEIWKIRK